MDASNLPRRQLCRIALEVLPTKSVIPRQMTDEGQRGQPFGRNGVPSSIYKVARMEAAFVDEIGNNVVVVVRMV
jgi:hypothetical protein